MRIVVLGAGTVGSSIADLLCRYRHSVTVVDSSMEKTRRVNEMLDVGVVTGSAAESTTLFQAGVSGSDICLAVTGVDEVNLVAGSLAKAMGAHRTMARVFAPVYRDLSTFDYQRHFKIDRLLSLEHLAALEFARGIRNPGSLAVETLARGELEVQEWEVQPSTRSVGVALKDFDLPKGVRVGSIVRDGKTWIATADDVFQVGDRVTVIGRRGDIDELRGAFQKKNTEKKMVVIAGGGETGYNLARILEGKRFAVLLMELDPARCQFLANHLKYATVVQADATRRVTLEEERVTAADVFVACIGDDEDNIMAGVEARDIGAKSVMALINRPDYANIVGKLGIDLAVSPREVMAKQVHSFLNTGSIISRTQLAGGVIAVLELEVYAGAPVTEHVLANLRLPRQCLIAAVTREDFVKVPGADDRLKPGDTVVTLVQDSAIDEMLPLFAANGR
jgi:trk system potassium uptake protein TrkA